MIGKEEKGLYISMQNSSQVAAAMSSVSFNKSLELWHCRIGHSSYDQLLCLPFLKHFNKPHSICTICPKAKQHRPSFHSSKSTTSAPFDLVHVDTWGPYRHPTHNGFRYFLTLVDDNTRCTWTFLMANKSNALCILQSFVNLVKTQFQVSLKVIRTDNAPEFSEPVAQKFYSDNGIQHQTSCVESPQ